MKKYVVIQSCDICLFKDFREIVKNQYGENAISLLLECNKSFEMNSQEYHNCCANSYIDVY